MRVPVLWLAIAGVCAGQSAAPISSSPTSNPLLANDVALQLARRITQLMESAAAAVPGLSQATEPIRRAAEQTVSAMVLTPRSAVLTNQFLSQIHAWAALSEAYPRPNPFPALAADQFTELREDQDRMRIYLRALLDDSVRALQLREADPNNLKRYADANSKLPPSSPKSPRVVFMGDSITDSWRLNEYFTGRDFVNRGISGQTTTQMLGRFLQDVVALQPVAVLILGGTNDIAKGIPANGIEDNLAMMGDIAKAHGIQPFFASILPVSDYHKDADPRFEMTKARPPYTIQQVNLWLKEYCRREGFTYVDYYGAMVDSNGQLPADQADDGLHPNAKGYRVMSPVALQSIDRLAKPTAPPTPAQKRRFGLPGSIGKEQ